MEKRSRLYSSLVLLAIYAFFFASTNLFYHSHQIENMKIVHSHPWSGGNHAHSTGQILLINIISAQIYEQSACVTAPDAVAVFLNPTESPFYVESVPVREFHFVSLRDPPCHEDRA